LFPNAKEAKKGTFSDVLGVSSSAELDSGRCPKNPPTFEKVGSKLFYLRQLLFSCQQNKNPTIRIHSEIVGFLYLIGFR